MVLYDDIKYGESAVNEMGVNNANNRLLASDIVENIILDGNRNLTNIENLRNVIAENKYVIPQPPVEPLYIQPLSKDEFIEQTIDDFTKSLTIYSSWQCRYFIIMVLPLLNQEDFYNTNLGTYVKNALMQYGTYASHATYSKYCDIRNRHAENVSNFFDFKNWYYSNMTIFIECKDFNSLSKLITSKFSEYKDENIGSIFDYK